MKTLLIEWQPYDEEPRKDKITVELDDEAFVKATLLQTYMKQNWLEWEDMENPETGEAFTPDEFVTILEKWELK